jgi:ABC-type uncharacterized transport system substrate-binding protein
MRRREFIALLGGAAAAWPLAARAQQPAMPVIGFLHTASASGWAPYVIAFHKGLMETGYVEGHNVAIEYRWAEDRTDRVPALAADLVARQVAVIAANGPSARAAMAATSSIPIVFNTAADPIKLGLVLSLNRPGGNATGVSLLSAELEAKRLGLLHELVPQSTAIAALVNPNFVSPTEQLDLMRDAASKLGRQLHVVNASVDDELETGFAGIADMRADALIVATDPFLVTRQERIVALAARYAIPAIYPLREFAMAGGLMSYSPSLFDAYRQVGIYTGKILKGAKPADLPVMQSAKFEFVINLKTARTLGLQIPDKLLTLADEVVE